MAFELCSNHKILSGDSSLAAQAKRIIFGVKQILDFAHDTHKQIAQSG